MLKPNLATQRPSKPTGEKAMSDAEVPKRVIKLTKKFKQYYMSNTLKKR